MQNSSEHQIVMEKINIHNQEPLSVRPLVRPFTLSNTNISETSRLIAIKCYMKHPWGRVLKQIDQNSVFHDNK